MKTREIFPHAKEFSCSVKSVNVMKRTFRNRWKLISRQTTIFLIHLWVIAKRQMPKLQSFLFFMWNFYASSDGQYFSYLFLHAYLWLIEEWEEVGWVGRFFFYQLRIFILKHFPKSFRDYYFHSTVTRWKCNVHVSTSCVIFIALLVEIDYIYIAVLCCVNVNLLNETFKKIKVEDYI